MADGSRIGGVVMMKRVVGLGDPKLPAGPCSVFRDTPFRNLPLPYQRLWCRPRHAEKLERHFAGSKSA